MDYLAAALVTAHPVVSILLHAAAASGLAWQLLVATCGHLLPCSLITDAGGSILLMTDSAMPYFSVLPFDTPGLLTLLSTPLTPHFMVICRTCAAALQALLPGA
jgi:hypothetical protein